jgi:hypothetical protein
MPALPDADGVPDGFGFGGSGKPIEVKDTLVIAILTQLTERQRLLDAGPASWRGMCIEKIADTVRHSVAMLAGDLPIADPAPAYWPFKAARTCVQCS